MAGQIYKNTNFPLFFVGFFDFGGSRRSFWFVWAYGRSFGFERAASFSPSGSTGPPLNHWNSMKHHYHLRFVRPRPRGGYNFLLRRIFILEVERVFARARGACQMCHQRARRLVKRETIKCRIGSVLSAVFLAFVHRFWIWWMMVRDVTLGECEWRETWNTAHSATTSATQRATYIW